jgi:predicted alpha/beta superfamily hydrolase
MRNKLILATLFFFLATCITYSQEQDFKFLHGLGETKHHQINYQILNQTYHIYVMLPENMENNKKYPTVYLLDGGITYPLLSSYYKYLRYGEELPQLIIVGISYGTDDWQKGNMRSRDFTAKAVERTFWGGAPEFSKFLSAELFPFIEYNYPSDSTHRIIFGQSLGGQFVLYVAQTKPSLFWGYIASNPALHRNLDFFLETKPIPINKIKLPRLFVSSGSKDELTFREPAIKWFQFWNGQKTRPWFLKTTSLEGQSHFSAAPEAFRKGLNWIFQED